MLAWSHKDELTEPVRLVFAQVAEGGAIAPVIWTLEVANGLQMAVRRRRITRPYRDELLANFRRLPIEIDGRAGSMAWDTLLYLSDRHDLTVYDAAYLELALRRRLPLATLDDALIKAARADGIEVLPRP